jgi:hypothetical protein
VIESQPVLISRNLMVCCFMGIALLRGIITERRRGFTHLYAFTNLLNIADLHSCTHHFRFYFWKIFSLKLQKEKRGVATLIGVA